MNSAVAFRFLADLTGPAPAFRPMACTAFPAPAGAHPGRSSRPAPREGRARNGEATRARANLPAPAGVHER